MTDIRFVKKRLLTISAMNVELPPFKTGRHNSESVSTLDRDITLLMKFLFVLFNNFDVFYATFPVGALCIDYQERIRFFL